MAKKFSIFLTFLLIFSLFPKIAIGASTVGLCSEFFDIQYRYNYEGYSYGPQYNSTFPNGVSAVFLDLKGTLPDGYYRYGSPDDKNNGYSYPSKAQGGKISLTVDGIRDSSVLNKGPHLGNLHKVSVDESKPLGAGNEGKYEGDYCTGISYFVGNNYTKKTCEITFDDETPSIQQKIMASVKQAPQSQSPDKKYKIMYNIKGTSAIVDYFADRNESDEKVEIDENGNGSFTFKTTATTRTSVTLRLFDYSGRATVRDEEFCNKTFSIGATDKPPTDASCVVYPENPAFTNAISIKATNLIDGQTYYALIKIKGAGEAGRLTKQSVLKGVFSFDGNPPLKLDQGNYFAEIYDSSDAKVCTTKDFHVIGANEIPNSNPKKCGTGKDDLKCTTAGLGSACEQGKNPGIKTAIGCIHTNPVDLTKDLLKFGLGIGGGLSFLMMLFGAFQMMTSAGNPETLNAGRQRLTSAIIGLLFVILSILLLQIIGWNILQLPGFGTKII